MNTTSGENTSFITPNWPAPAHVRALCSTRLGGVSVNSAKGQYASFNLGDHVGDDAAAVAANRALWQQQLQAQTVFLQQVHGIDCLDLTPDTPQASVADACSTQEPGLACTIIVADCLPVLFCNAAGTQVAAAHAGWRGLVGGVLHQALYAFLPNKAAESAWAAPKKEVPNSRLLAVAQEAKVMAWLGPCIGQGAFEVGAEVRAAFVAAYPWSSDCFVPSPTNASKSFCDLAAIARGVLQRLGVAVYGNDSSAPWCSYSHTERWFSHRRAAQQGRQAGRMAASVWLSPMR